MARRPILPCCLLFCTLLLSACGGEPEKGVLGARGPLVEQLRGSAPRPSNATAGNPDVLAPEPGNIWAEGLGAPAPRPNR